MEHDPRLVILVIIPVVCCLILLGYLRHHQKQIEKEIKKVRDERLKAKK